MNGETARLPQRLLHVLAAHRGERGTTAGFVSGAELSAALGVSRTAIWKAVGQLRDLDVDIDALPRQGYRLVQPCTPLTAEGIRSALPAQVHARLRELRVSWSTGSTNADLLRAAPPAVGTFALHVAEHQSAGRGRRGRSWLAPPGGALCLSWSWRFETLPMQPGSLSLVVGLAVVRALESLGAHGAALKWPNDLVTAEGKLAGILVEMVSEAGGPALAVVGLGLNVALGPRLRERIRDSGNEAAELQSLVDPLPSRNALAAAIVSQGVEALLRWERQGFAPFAGEWQERDALRDREIVLRSAGAELRGIARGVDLDGALLVDDGGALHRCASGEASVRLRP